VPSSPPAMAATVSVSLPPRTAASSAGRRWSTRNTPVAGSSSGTGVVATADHAACSASTTQPLLAKSDGCEGSATVSREANRSRRSMAVCCSPIRAFSSPVRMWWQRSPSPSGGCMPHDCRCSCVGAPCSLPMRCQSSSPIGPRLSNVSSLRRAGTCSSDGVSAGHHFTCRAVSNPAGGTLPGTPCGIIVA